MTDGVSSNQPEGFTIHFRWLGAAGIELSYGSESLVSESLLIDPFFTRPPFWRLWFGRVASNPALIPASLPRCDHILVSHAHYDHLMDVPTIAHRTQARVVGSSNTCALLRICGLNNAQILKARPGDKLELGRFNVEVLAARHSHAPGFSPGRVGTDLQTPLRLRDYVMDEDFSFLIQLPGLRLLNWCGVGQGPAPQADVLFLVPSTLPGFYESLLTSVQPRLIIPVHWDDIFRPLSKSIRPGFELPRLAWPPLRRIDFDHFKQTVQRSAPLTRVLIPEIFEAYDLAGYLSTV